MSQLHDDIEAVGPLTNALIETASGFAAQDLARPSLCEGWSRGHILAHVARNADALGRLADWAATGRRQEMYPGGTDARDAEIEAGADRPVAEHVADLRRSADALDRLFPALEGDLSAERVEARGGLEVAAVSLPFLRIRELVLHHVDLVAGYSLSDVDPDLLRRLVDDAVMRLRLSRRAPSMKVRTDEGDVWSIGDGTAYVTGSREGVLRWLSRRIGDGVVADGGLPDLPRGA